jgi:hypothetical protein
MSPKTIGKTPKPRVKNSQLLVGIKKEMTPNKMTAIPK